MSPGRLPALHRRVKRDDDQLVMTGRPLIAGLVWPMIVRVSSISLQRYAEMALTIDSIRFVH
jgi:hypothetical protein